MSKKHKAVMTVVCTASKGRGCDYYEPCNNGSTWSECSHEKVGRCTEKELLKSMGIEWIGANQ